MKLEANAPPARRRAPLGFNPPARKTPSPPAEAPSPRRELTEKELAQLWQQFKQTGDLRARNRLLLHYQPLVNQAARRIKSRLPREIELADLQSAGFFGLYDAVKRFDPSRGVKFEAYCQPRIHGAILDERRALDWVPRSARLCSHRIRAAKTALETRLGRPPHPYEMADKLGCSLAEYRKLVKEADTAGVFHVTRSRHQDHEHPAGIGDIDGIEDTTSEGPSSRTQREEFKQLVTKGLSDAEQLMITLHYYRQMTMREIGRSLGVSESRVSQMHASILARLRRNRSLRTEAMLASS